jgi:hypothetical protein
MMRCPSVCPKLIPLCPVFRDNVALRQALPNTAKLAETQRQTGPRTNPNHVIGSFWANPVAEIVPAGHRRPRAFPHKLDPAPAASSWGGFSTRADTAPPATVTPQPASKNFTDPDLIVDRDKGLKSG